MSEGRTGRSINPLLLTQFCGAFNDQAWKFIVIVLAPWAPVVALGPIRDAPMLIRAPPAGAFVGLRIVEPERLAAACVKADNSLFVLDAIHRVEPIAFGERAN